MSSLKTSEDRQIARQVQRAIGDGRLFLEQEAVCNIHGPLQTLYHEALCRMRSAQNQSVIYPNAFIPSLERLGLMRAFDRYIVRQIIETLRLQPSATLGCNVSGQSVTNDGWWDAVFDSLVVAPEVATRLVIEVTETSPIAAEQGRSFVQRFRSLGCRVAIDDLGAGYGVANSVDVGPVDIVKIDYSLLSGVRAGKLSPTAFAGFVAGASRIAKDVVIEGVETHQDLEVVRSTDAGWGQGYYYCI